MTNVYDAIEMGVLNKSADEIIQVTGRTFYQMVGKILPFTEDVLNPYRYQDLSDIIFKQV